MAPSQVIILGGGITGLSSVFHLSRRFPSTPLTLLEASTSLGGWIRTRRVPTSTGSVLLEAGPRTLRPRGRALLELVRPQTLIVHASDDEKDR